MSLEEFFSNESMYDERFTLTVVNLVLTYRLWQAKLG